MRKEIQNPNWKGNLFDHQCDALLAIRECGGVVIDASVGAGKTVISYAAGYMAGAERPLLLIPAGRDPGTRRDFTQFHNEWLQSKVKAPYWLSYETISNDAKMQHLKDRRPDMLIFDEADYLSNSKAGRTRMLTRYIDANPDVKVVVMSATLYRKSVMSVYHLSKWALKDLSPFPTHPSVAARLGAIIDPIRLKAQQPELPRDPEPWMLEIIKDWDKPAAEYGKFVRSRKGWFAAENSFDGEITIDTEYVPAHPRCEQVLQEVLDTKTLPTGEPIVPVGSGKLAESSALWRLAGELSCGYYSVYKDQPPAKYLKARREWFKVVTDNIEHYFTLRGVTAACERGLIPGVRELSAWRRARDETEVEFITVPVKGVDTTPTVDYAVDWLKRTEKAILWVERVEIARIISQRVGCEYYSGGQGLKGRPLIEDERSSCVATIQANGVGKNLQHFHQNLILTATSSYTVQEQMIGRTFRTGQRSPVYVRYIFVDGLRNLQRDAFEQAKIDACYAEDMTGTPSAFGRAGLLTDTRR